MEFRIVAKNLVSGWQSCESCTVEDMQLLSSFGSYYLEFRKGNN